MTIYQKEELLVKSSNQLQVNIDQFNFIIKFMIRLIKICNHLQFFNLSHYAEFSTQAINSRILALSKKAQRAIWATAIIRKISLAEQSEQITNQSLREQLLNLQHPSKSFPNLQYQRLLLKLRTFEQKQFEFSEQIKKEMLSIFQDGANLSTTVFSQQRITQGKDVIRSSTDSSYKKKFVFCPNVLVTKPIFSHYLECQRNTLIYGGFGISKTVSLVLLQYLSSFVNKYVYQSFGDKVLQEEYSFLKQNYLNLQIPKLFYWSLKLLDTEQKIKDIILQQADQLSEEQKNKLQEIPSFQRFAERISKKYTKKGIKIWALIDQINVLASKFRQWNYFYISYQQNKLRWTSQLQTVSNKIKQLRKKNNIKQLQQAVEEKKLLQIKHKDQQLYWQQEKNINTQIKIQGQTLRYRMKNFQKIGSVVIYNSSLNIEKNLIEKQTSLEKRRTMDIQNGHTQLPLVQINYFKFLANKWGCNQLSHYFWFQIQKKLKNNNEFLHKNKLNQFKLIFYDEVKDQRWPLFVRPLNIADMLRNDQKLYFGDQININFSIDNFRKIAKKLIKQLPQNSIQIYRRKIISFLAKQGQIQKRNRIMFLHIIFALAKAQDQNSTQNIQIQIPKLQEGPIKKHLYKHLAQSYVNRQLFSFGLDQQKQKISFLWTPKQLVDIINPILYKQTLNVWNIDPKLTQNLLTKSKAALGLYLQATLIWAIKSKKICFCFDFNKQKKTKKYQLQPKQFSSFQQLNKNKKNKPTVDKNFAKIFQKALENPDLFIFGQPVAISQNQQKQTSNSKAIDCVFVKYDSLTKKFLIVSIDFTVTKSHLSSKIEKAKQAYNAKKDTIQCKEHLTNTKTKTKKTQIYYDQHQVNYKVQHIIIGGQKQMKENKKFGFLSIMSTQILKVQLIAKTLDEQTKNMLEYWNILKDLCRLQNQIKNIQPTYQEDLIHNQQNNDQ